MKKNSDLKTKNIGGMALIYIILFFVFNLLVFTVFKKHTGVFWVSYVFMTAAFIVQIASVYLSFKKSDIESVFFGIPLASLSVYYLCAELAAGTVFMIFQQAGVKLALVIQILMLAAYAVVAIISLMARDTVREVESGIKEKVADLKSVLVDIEILRDSCENPELKEKLRKLSETVKYSDPISNEAVEDVEQRIRWKVAELKACVEDSNTEGAAKACKELEMLYSERNKKLAISK